MYVFLIKEERCFDKYNETWEKISNIIKNNNNELIYNKKYLKSERNSTQKKAFNVFIPVIPVMLYQYQYY